MGLDGQRAAVRASELGALLDVTCIKINRFGWDTMDEVTKNAIKDDWADALFHYEKDEVKDAIKAVIAESKGEIRSINEHHVISQIEKARAKEVSRLPRMQPEPEPVRCTPEELEERKRLSEELLGSFPSERG